MVGNCSRSRRVRSFKRLTAAGAATLALAVASACDGSSADANAGNSVATSDTKDTIDTSDTVDTSDTADTSDTSDTSDPSDTVEDGADGDAVTETTLGLSLLTDDQRRLIEGLVTDDMPRSIETTTAWEAGTSNSMTSVIEVDADGDTHALVHPALIGADPTDQEIETWGDGTWLYAEFSGFPHGDDVDDLEWVSAVPIPDAWAEPGVFKVNLGLVGDKLGLTPAEVAEVISYATGQDPQENPFLYYVAVHADDADDDPNDPSLKRIESTWDEIIDELDRLTGSTSPPTTEFADERLAQAAINLTFSIDDQGRIDLVTASLDATEPSTGGDDAVATSSPGAAEQPTVMQFSTRSVVDYAFDDDIAMPSGVADDRTAAFIEWYSRGEITAEEILQATSTTSG